MKIKFALAAIIAAGSCTTNNHAAGAPGLARMAGKVVLAGGVVVVGTAAGTVCGAVGGAGIGAVAGLFIGAGKGAQAGIDAVNTSGNASTAVIIPVGGGLLGAGVGSIFGTVAGAGHGAVLGGAAGFTAACFKARRILLS